MNAIPPSPDKDAVDHVLRTSGLQVEGEEYAQLIRIYPLLREQIASLQLAETRYAEPADIYPAAVRG